MKTDDGIDSKHMDRHARPYLCREPGCKDIEGFQYPGGLLRHQGEVHPPHRGAEPPRFCPYNDCKRSTGLGFLTKNILDEHLRCLHPAYVYEHMSKQNGNGLECEDKSSDHEPRYCYCGEPSYGEMVGCDNTDCPREWFHLLCAGLTKVPGQNGELLAVKRMCPILLILVCVKSKVVLQGMCSIPIPPKPNQ